MKIQGKVQDSTTVQAGSGPAKRFWVVTPDSKNFQVYDSQNSDIRDGQTVEVVGDLDSEGTVQSQSVKRIDGSPKSRKGLILLASGLIVLIVIIIKLPKGGGAPTTAATAKKLVCRGSANPDDLVVSFNAPGGGSGSTLALSFKKSNAGINALQPGECSWDGAKFSGSDPATISQDVPTFGGPGAHQFEAQVRLGTVTSFILFTPDNAFRWPQALTHGTLYWAFTAYRSGNVLKVTASDTWQSGATK